MQALILAAGMGTRLEPLTQRSTKCMVPFHGRPLITYLLDSLMTVGIQHAILVVGHGADEVRTTLGQHYDDLPLHYIENTEYRTTNNIYSLSLAAEQLSTDDTLLIESDLIVDRAILQVCARDSAAVVAAVAPYESWMDGTVTQIDHHGHITSFFPSYAFDPECAPTYYKTVNIYKMSRTFSHEYFVPQLRTHLSTVGRGVYYEEVFGRIVSQHLAPIKAIIIDGSPWYEIDTVEDLRRAEALFPA